MSGRFSLASFLLHSRSLASFSLHCVVLLRPVPGTLANYEQVGKPARATRHAFGGTSRQVGRACRQVGKGKTKHPAPVKPCNHYAVFFRPCAFQGKNKHPLPAARLAVFDKDMNVLCTPSGSSPAGGVFRASFGLELEDWGRDPDHGSRTEDKKRNAPDPLGRSPARGVHKRGASRVLHSFIIPQKPPGRPLLLLLGD